MSNRWRFLDRDEELVYVARPHWWRIVRPIAAALLVIAALAIGLEFWRPAPVWFGWLLLSIFFMVIVRLVVQIARWRSTILLVTSRRLVVRAGIAHRIGREIPLRRIESLSYHQSLFARLIASGVISVEASGEGSPKPIFAVHRPAQAVQAVHEVIEALERIAERSETREDEPRAIDYRDRLDELFARGAITKSELEQLRETR